MLTVALGPDADRHRAILAGLPESFRVVPGSDADVVAVSGARAGWIEAAGDAIGRGAAAVLVTRPAAGDPHAVLALHESATSAGVVIGVESPVLDPAWAAIAPRLREAAGDAALIDSLVAVDGSLSTGLIEQLALVRAVTDDFRPAPGPVHGAAGYAVAGDAGPVPVSLTGTVGHPQLRFDLRSQAAHWSVLFDPGAPARPTRAVRYDGLGGELVPDVYETAGRAAWRQLADAVAGERAMPYTLADLGADLGLAELLMTSEGGTRR